MRWLFTGDPGFIVSANSADRVYVSLGTENRTLGSPNPNPNPNPNKVP